MKIIALANQKGGVAKTTTTYNLATVKALEGYRVLMVDLDPQSSLTIACKMIPGQEKWNSCYLFDKKTDPVDCCYRIPSLEVDNLYIIPSDIELARTDIGLINQMSREKLLKKSLQKLEAYFDYIFIDCPPQLGMLVTNALVASDEVIIPTKAEYLSYRGMRLLYDTIDNIVSDTDLNPDLKVKGVVVTMYEKVINDQRDILELYNKENNVLGIVKKSADTYRSIVDGTPVVISNKRSAVSKAYVDIAKKI